MNFSFNQFRKTTAFIHLSHLKHNVELLRSQLKPAEFFCPMVKANAYGHGDITIVKELSKVGVQRFGVGVLEEGLWLKQQNVSAEIICFGPIESTEAWEELLRAGITPVLSDMRHLEIIKNSSFTLDFLNSKNGRKNKIGVHLKFDTGMNRLGFEVEDSVNLLQEIPNFIKVDGVLTHLHSSENLFETGFDQMQRFKVATDTFAHLNPLIHCLNSGGLLARNRALEKNKNSAGDPHANRDNPSASDKLHFEKLLFGARPGISIYGLTSLDDSYFSDITLKPVMSLRSNIVKIQKLKKNETVSYGATWKAKTDVTYIGVVPLGYADGYPRILSSVSQILCEGKKVPVIGRVCMDYVMVDLTTLVGSEGADQLLDAEVVLFGYSKKGQLLKTEEVASWGQTIPWEIVTGVGERVPRKAVEFLF